MRMLIISVIFSLMFVAGCCGPLSNEGKYSQTSGSSQEALFTPQPDLDAKIVGCNTNFGLGGETTTVYVTVANSGSAAADDVTVTFGASDSDEDAPRVLTIGRLPAQKQRTISYAVDTRMGEQTTVQVAVNAKSTYTINDYSADCRKMDAATIENLNKIVQLGLQAI